MTTYRLFDMVIKTAIYQLTPPQIKVTKIIHKKPFSEGSEYDRIVLPSYLTGRALAEAGVSFVIQVYGTRLL